MQLQEGEERHMLSLGYSLVFWSLVLALYWQYNIEEFFVGFHPHEGFPG
jgi:hypothetical protein